MGLRFPSYPPGVAAVISQEIPNTGTEDGGLRTEGAGPIVLDRVYASNLSIVVNGIHPHPVIVYELVPPLCIIYIYINVLQYAYSRDINMHMHTTSMCILASMHTSYYSSTSLVLV